MNMLWLDELTHGTYTGIDIIESRPWWTTRMPKSPERIRAEQKLTKAINELNRVKAQRHVPRHLVVQAEHNVTKAHVDLAHSIYIFGPGLIGYDN
jgi:transcription initiation factor TFIIIB Brf1 subunit/transcription initiation factor TFIIB